MLLKEKKSRIKTKRKIKMSIKDMKYYARAIEDLRQWLSVFMMIITIYYFVLVKILYEPVADQIKATLFIQELAPAALVVFVLMSIDVCILTPAHIWITKDIRKQEQEEMEELGDHQA